ncbi:SPOR domain-containing protein [Tsuneonella sp. HG249]
MSRSTRTLTLAAGTALASLALAGCATKAAPRAELSASNAEVALKKGKVTSAIAHAEAAVLADPRNPAYRTMLGAAYMEAGRFLSARTSFDDALELGDESARTALGFALAAIATGDQGAALEVLEDWRDEIPAADLGLALALAGETEQAVHVLSNAVRGGDNTPKARQNLAYALALNGSWAGARIMAAEDVPADQLDARMAQWAELAQTEQGGTRVAALLGTSVVADGGQPAQLALANHPTVEQLAAQAAETSFVAGDLAAAELPPVAGGELPAQSQAFTETSPTEFAAAAPRPAAEQDFQAAFAERTPAAATPGQMIAAAVDFVSQPVVQQTPARVTSATQAPLRVAPKVERAFAAASGNHLVQLGSFSSDAGARRAWAIYAKRFPQLSAYDMVITRAVVRGKTYYRVSAGGLARTAASSVCSSVRNQGQACFAWTQARPMPGAVNPDVRMASR